MQTGILSNPQADTWTATTELNGDVHAFSIPAGGNLYVVADKVPGASGVLAEVEWPFIAVRGIAPAPHFSERLSLSVEHSAWWIVGALAAIHFWKSVRV